MNFLAPLLCVFLPGLPVEGITDCWETPTVRERVNHGHIIVAAKYVSTEKPIPHQTIGRTKYQIVEVVQDHEKTLSGENELVVERYWLGEPGELYLLYGSPSYTNYWWMPIPITKASLGYIQEVATQHIVRTNWLEFFVGDLEHSDPFINDDAYRECEKFSLKEFQEIASKLPREKLRKWIKDGKLVCRQGLYGLMLGLCGDQLDAELLADIIKQPVPEGCDGREGVMCGYLLLQGEKGLELIEAKLMTGQQAKSLEPYIARRALQFAWLNTEIPKDRLKKSMRLSLKHPTLASTAVWQLTDWKDWEAQEQVMAVYENKKIKAPQIKVSIARYFVACIKDTAINDDQNPIEEHAIRAKNHLFTLRQNDPWIVEQAERSYHLRN